MKIYPLWTQTASAVTSFTTGYLQVMDYGNYAFGVTITGSDVVGTLQLQAAFEPTFARPFLVQAATAITASADTLFNFSDVNYPYVRVIWTYTSGTGNITIDASNRELIISRGG